MLEAIHTKSRARRHGDRVALHKMTCALRTWRLAQVLVRGLQEADNAGSVL
jgi:hypothetical protein